MRDSGVYVPNSDEDNSFEDAEENPIDPLLNNAALLPMPEDEADQGSPDENEEEVEEEEGNNMPPQVNANPPNAVQPQQLTTLLQFDSNRGETFVNWIEYLETAKETCS